MTNDSEQSVEIVIGIPGKMGRGKVSRGSTVFEALHECGFGDFHGYSISLNGHQADENETVHEGDRVLLLKPVLGRMTVFIPNPRLPYRANLLSFWFSAAMDLWFNLKYGWPILAAIVIYLVAMSAAALWVEPNNIKTYWEALYFTWISMTTVGYGDVVPKSPSGRFIASVDGLVEIILIGVVVWLVTTSLTRR